MGNGREQVGEGLAGAGAGLGHQVVLAVEGIRDGAQHFDLLGPVLIARKEVGEHATRLEHRREIAEIDGQRVLTRLKRLGTLPPLEKGAIRNDLLERGDRRVRSGRPLRGCFAIRKHGPQGPVDAGQAQHFRQAEDFRRDAPGQHGRVLAQNAEQLPGGLRVVERAMLLGRGDAEVGDQAGEAVGRPGRDQDRCKLPGVEARVFEEQAAVAEKAQIELDVVADDGQAADKSLERAGELLEPGLADDILVADAGQQGDFIGDGPAGVDERGEGLDRLSITVFDGANLDDRVLFSTQPGRFQVQRNVDARQQFCSDN